MTIEAGVDVDNLWRAIEAIAREVRQIAIDGPTTEEVAFAREYVMGRLLLSLESEMRAAGWYATQLLREVTPILSPTDVLQVLAAVRAEATWWLCWWGLLAPSPTLLRRCWKNGCLPGFAEQCNLIAAWGKRGIVTTRSFC